MVDVGPQLNARCRPEAAGDLPWRPIGPSSSKTSPRLLVKSQDFERQCSQGWQEVQEQEQEQAIHLNLSCNLFLLFSFRRL